MKLHEIDDHSDIFQHFMTFSDHEVSEAAIKLAVFSPIKPNKPKDLSTGSFTE